MGSVLTLACPLLGLLPSVGIGSPCYKLMRVKGFPLYFCWHRWGSVEPTNFSVVFGWSRAVLVKKLFLIFVLLDCSFPGPLAKETRLQMELSLSEPIGLSRLLAFSTLCLEYMKQRRKHRELTQQSFFGFQSQSPVCLFLYTFQSLLIFVSYIMSKAFSWNREKYVCFIFPG